ncbi:hypothetical protein TSUD_89500 [Trifolium subterraneum]|uniref:Uncharacterized protein n=1 Tax=Trifolium subterraneum TaxID=3900 RepID=A0A2Z6NEE1_TRISU|nr:hypothetical protein TSUD_89500 [Trifolium subterraneum]
MVGEWCVVYTEQQTNRLSATPSANSGSPTAESTLQQISNDAELLPWQRPRYEWWKCNRLGLVYAKFRWHFCCSRYK